MGSDITGNNEGLLRTVEMLIDNGDAKQALKFLSEKIESAPDDLELLNRRAEIYLYVNKRKDAREQLQDIFAFNNQYPPALLTYAHYKVEIGELDSALFIINQGLTFAPSTRIEEGLYSLQGHIHMSENRYKDAEKSLYIAASSPKVSRETMSKLSRVLIENNKYEEAAIILRESVELFGSNIETNINMGYVCNKIGEYYEAMHYIQDALADEPDNPYAQANMAQAKLNLGKLDEAYKLAEKSIQNENSNAFAYMVKGQCLILMDEKPRACREFKKAIQLGYSVMYGQTEITKMIIASCGTK